MATLTQPRRDAGRGPGFSLRALLPARARGGAAAAAQGKLAEAASAAADRNRLLEEQNRALRLTVLRLRRLVHVDSLTGLANRRWLDRALQAEIRRAAREAAPLGLVLCDVDFFKRCNDAFGHAGGDAVLAKLGEVLRASCRRAGDVAARYGGEEFALLLPQVGIGDAIHVGETLRRKVAGLSLTGTKSPGPVGITVSVGVTAFHAATPCRPADMLRSADSALYRAKTGGRNRTEFRPIEPSGRGRR